MGKVEPDVKGMFLYSAVSSPLDRLKRFTLFALPVRPVHSDIKRRVSVVVSTFAWHAAGRWFNSRTRHVSLLGVKTWLSTLEIVYLCVFRRRH